MTVTIAQDVFQPEQYRALLVTFRPVDYIEHWHDGFGKTQPAVVSEFSPLEQVVNSGPKKRRKDVSPKERVLEQLLGAEDPGEAVPVEKPEARLVTVKHVYLVEALRAAQGMQGICAGWIVHVQTPWVLMPPTVSEYGRVFQHCQALGWL
ncbi:hypothetical protein [Streptomyces katrae]|uniref:hypothetical protein n=1 Tax=Streptomyces katrae TaxID=68223 RepID=UPI0005F92294|nr:hypothetical protein [Streptomyces katrae]